MRCAAHDATQMYRARFLWLERIRDIVLNDFARAPARCIEITIIHRQVDVGQQWRDCLKPLEEGRQFVFVGRLGRDFDDLLDFPTVFDPVPYPDRARKILERNYNANEAPSLG